MSEQDERAWAEILSEPMTSVRHTGWRAVSMVADISPLREATLVLEAPESWLIVPPINQGESEAAARSLPPSLAEQLSLTWAARRRRRSRAAEEEPERQTEVLVEDEPEPGPLKAAPAAPVRRPFWNRPLAAVYRMLRPAPIAA